MNDDRLLLAMRRWLQEERVALPDAEKAARRIASQLTTTRQRRRRQWRLPFLARAARPLDAIGTTDYQPTPIQATNGHTPTVIGRTTSMLSPVKAITAGALIFALGGAFLIAQPFDRQGGGVPGAQEEETELSTPAYVTWEVTGDPTFVGPDEFDQVLGRMRGLLVSGTLIEASDPRLSGSYDYVANGNYQNNNMPDYGAVELRSWRMENDGGAWTGTSTYVDVGDGIDGGPAMVAETSTLIGEGGYEGLIAILDRDTREGKGDGVILELPVPSIPEGPEVPAE